MSYIWVSLSLSRSLALSVFVRVRVYIRTHGAIFIYSFFSSSLFLLHFHCKKKVWCQSRGTNGAVTERWRSVYSAVAIAGCVLFLAPFFFSLFYTFTYFVSSSTPALIISYSSSSSSVFFFFFFSCSYWIISSVTESEARASGTPLFLLLFLLHFDSSNNFSFAYSCRIQVVENDWDENPVPFTHRIVIHRDFIW